MAGRPRLNIDSDEGRLCCHCKTIKPFSKYTKDIKSGYRGFRRECKDCANDRARKYYADNKEKVCDRTRANHKERRKDPSFKVRERDRRIQFCYGITLAGYNSMFENQKEVCAICGGKETAKAKGVIKNLSVDHDHKSGKVRAILCSKCNAILGLADDDTGLLSKCISYLRRHSDGK